MYMYTYTYIVHINAVFTHISYIIARVELQNYALTGKMNKRSEYLFTTFNLQEEALQLMLTNGFSIWNSKSRIAMRVNVQDRENFAQINKVSLTF